MGEVVVVKNMEQVILIRGNQRGITTRVGRGGAMQSMTGVSEGMDESYQIFIRIPDQW